MNLQLVETPKNRMQTIVSNRKTGKDVVFHLTPEFSKRNLDLPYDKQPTPARDIAAAPNESIFSMDPVRSPGQVRAAPKSGTFPMGYMNR